MTFEKYIDEDVDFLSGIDKLTSYPSVFELICLLPLSRRIAFSEEEPSSLDDSII